MQTSTLINYQLIILARRTCPSTDWRCPLCNHRRALLFVWCFSLGQLLDPCVGVILCAHLRPNDFGGGV